MSKQWWTIDPAFNGKSYLRIFKDHTLLLVKVVTLSDFQDPVDKPLSKWQTLATLPKNTVVLLCGPSDGLFPYQVTSGYKNASGLFHFDGDRVINRVTGWLPIEALPCP